MNVLIFVNKLYYCAVIVEHATEARQHVEVFLRHFALQSNVVAETL